MLSSTTIVSLSLCGKNAEYEDIKGDEVGAMDGSMGRGNEGGGTVDWPRLITLLRLVDLGDAKETGDEEDEDESPSGRGITDISVIGESKRSRAVFETLDIVKAPDEGRERLPLADTLVQKVGRAWTISTVSFANGSYTPRSSMARSLPFSLSIVGLPRERELLLESEEDGRLDGFKVKMTEERLAGSTSPLIYAD